MSESLDDELEAHFKGVSDNELINRIEKAPEFKNDDEVYELNRRFKLVGLAWRWANQGDKERVQIYSAVTHDEQQIDDAIAEAREAGKPIDDATARAIASQIHGGETSAIYSFLANGRITEDLLTDIQETYSEFPDDEEITEWLRSLAEYASKRESKEAVEDWHNIWPTDPQQSNA